MKTQERIRIHRFRDSIAFSMDDTETLYLTPALAKAFARELRRYAKDCENTPFTESKLTTKELP